MNTEAMATKIRSYRDPLLRADLAFAWTMFFVQHGPEGFVARDFYTLAAG